MRKYSRSAFDWARPISYPSTLPAIPPHTRALPHGYAPPISAGVDLHREPAALRRGARGRIGNAVVAAVAHVDAETVARAEWRRDAAATDSAQSGADGGSRARRHGNACRSPFRSDRAVACGGSAPRRGRAVRTGRAQHTA